jgi:hypothetical protein
MNSWSRNSFRILNSNGTNCEFEYDRDRLGFRFSLEKRGTGDESDGGREAIAGRLLCHILIEQLPSKEIYDIWQRLYDTWEWAKKSRQVNIAHQVKVLPSIKRVYEKQVEPEFQVAED